MTRSGGGRCHAEILLGPQLVGFIIKFTGKLGPGKQEKPSTITKPSTHKPALKGQANKSAAVSNSNTKQEGQKETVGSLDNKVTLHAKLSVWPLHKKVEEQLCDACQKEWAKIATLYANHVTVDFSWMAV